MQQYDVRCGRIGYTNDLPVYAAFDAGAIPFPGTLISGVPAELNRMLLSGELHCSPLSSIFYARHFEQFALLPGICIAADGAARSVCCISAKPLRESAAETIALSKESATGRALLDVICRTWYGYAPAFAESDDPFAEHVAQGRPCLLIGDAAIDAALKSAPEHVYDLGSLWRELSGHPMVFAVWAARFDFLAAQPQAVAAASDALQRALQWGTRNKPLVIARAMAQAPRPAGFYETYFGGLAFGLDARRQAGLRHFFEKAAQCDVLAAAPRLAFAAESLANV